MRKNIENEVAACDICAKRKVYTGKTKKTLLPREDFGPLEQVVMDFAVFNDIKSSYQYVLVMIDRFSKLVSLVPLKKQDELSLADTFKNRWIYKFGKPRSILSDR